MGKRGLIFDLQGFSVHDGPGCRTLIFFKGCPLNCRWCSNPEGINPFCDLMFYQERCAGRYPDCGHPCEKACSQKAITCREIKVILDRNICRDCQNNPCQDECHYDALKLSGYYLEIEQLIAKIKRDRRYWGSGGGITLSGGEPMGQFEFVRELLKICYDSYIHTAIETCGFAPWEHFAGVLPYLDWIFYDLKHMDNEKHRQGTGAENRLILENAAKLASGGGECRLIFRLPLVPGFNDNTSNLNATANFIKGLGKKEVNILPFHGLGASKYELLGLNLPYNDLTPENDLKEAEKIFKAHDLQCYLGAETPF